MPFAGPEVGDPSGMLLGYSLDVGTFRPLLFDPAYGPSINRSGSLDAFGALGSGKCLSGGVEVVDPATGLVSRLDEAVAQARFGQVTSLTDRRRIRSLPVAAKIDGGTKPCHRVELASGRTLTATTTHPLLTPEGWRPLGELVAGSNVALPGRMPLPGRPARIPDEDVDFLALVLAEGIAHLSQVGCQLAGGAATSVRVEVETIPPVVFQLGADQLTRFLATLWMRDGSVLRAGGPVIVLASAKMARQIQHLLLRLGIQSGVRPNVSSHGGGSSFRARLTVYPQSWAAFREQIPLWGAKGERLAKTCARASHPNRGAPRWLAASEIVWDRVVSMEPVGDRRVYDLTVEPSHCFVANDVIVHNSHFVKTVAHAVLARGGQVVALDRTATGGYVQIAGVAPDQGQCGPPGPRLAGLPGPAAVLHRRRAGPLRPRIDASEVTSPSDLQRAALAEAVRAAARRPDGLFATVVEALEPEAAGNPDAAVVWRKLRTFARRELAGLAFGESQVPSLDAVYIVFHTPGLALPDREMLPSEHLARQLLPELIFSPALLYLVAARSVIFPDTRRFAALFDDAWALAASMQGRALLLDSARDGRKHDAAVRLASQHPNDLGDDEPAHLLRNRFVFRQSHAAAPAALRFLGLEASEAAVRALETAREGSCLLRDVRDRVGPVQVLPALTDEVYAAFDTNPARPGADRPAGPGPSPDPDGRAHELTRSAG